MSENYCKNVSRANVLAFSSCLFCPTNGPKPKEIQFITIRNREKQQIWTFGRLQPVNLFDFFFFLKTWTIESIIQTLSDAQVKTSQIILCIFLEASSFPWPVYGIL